MSDPFTVPSFSGAGSRQVSGGRKVQDQVIRAGILISTCRCNQRNGLQQECRKCRPTVTATSKPMTAPAAHQPEEVAVPAYNMASGDAHEQHFAVPESYNIQEGVLVDGQTDVKMKDGSTLDFSNVGYIDYGTSAQQYASQGQQQQVPQDSQVPLKAKESKTSRPASSQPYSMSPQQFAMPQQFWSPQMQMMSPMGDAGKQGQPSPMMYQQPYVPPYNMSYPMTMGSPMMMQPGMMPAQMEVQSESVASNQ